jgi:hypothetical protein
MKSFTAKGAKGAKETIQKAKEAKATPRVAYSRHPREKMSLSI